MTTTEWVQLCTQYLIARAQPHRRGDRGLTTTEVAVVTFLLVGAAIVVMGIIYAAAQNNANNIPDPQAPVAG